MLNVSLFSDGLSKIFDKESFLFEGFPPSIEDAAERWATAFDDYAKSVTPPSVTSPAAKEAFKAKFLTIDRDSGNGLSVIPDCFQSHAVILSSGMSPTYTGVPPTTPPVLDPVWEIGYNGGNSSEVIASLSSVIDAWIKTGTAVHNLTGAVVPWA